MNLSKKLALAIGHHQAGRLAKAEAAFRDVLAIAPANFDALLFLGLIAHQHGRSARAVELFSKAVAINPFHAPVLSNLGIAFEALGEPEQAAQAYRRALASGPGYVDAYANLGGLLAAQGRLDEAAACLERGLQVDSRHPLILTSLGNVLREKGRLMDAEACHRRSIAVDARRAAAHVSLGHVLHEQGQRPEAIACYRTALVLAPRAADTLCDLGNALVEENELEEAVGAYRRATEVDPAYARAHVHLGNALMQLGDLHAAEASLHEAMRLQPNSPQVRLACAHIKMMNGDYTSGLPLYESRFEEDVLSRAFASMHHRAAQLVGTPRWHGEDARGSSLLVWTDQGLGDSVMMLRYLPLLRARGVGRLAVYCEEPLVRLVRSFAAVDEIIPAGEPPPAGRFDLHCPIMSLPLAFGTRLDSIPGAVSYLDVPKAGASERLSGLQRPRVGLYWAGSRANPRDHVRSIPLECFAPLVEIPGLTFVSLQKGDEAAQLSATAWPIVDPMAECRDLLDTAALINELDLVIGVDSVVAHLAGALGKPMWLFNRFESEWRWLFEGEHAPWYPTVRVLRQPRRGDWESVIARAANDLRTALADFHFGIRRH